MADKRPRQKVFNYVNWDSLYTPKETKLTETQPLAVETQDNLSFNYDPFEVINQENRRQNALTLLKPPQTNGNGTQRPIETDSGISNVLTQKREFKPTDTISVSESTKQPLGEPKKFTPNSNLNVPMSDFEADLTVLQQMGDKVKTQEDADNFNLKLAEVKKKYPTLNLPQEVTERNLQFGFPQVKIPEIKYSDKKLGKMNDKERADAYQLLTRSIMSGKPITEVSKEDDLRGTQLGRILGSFGQGVLSTGAGIAGFQEYIGKKLGAEGYENVNKAIKENINGWVREIAPSNPNFMEQFASGLGSYSVFLPMGLGTMKLSEALLKISPKIAKWFGAGAMTTLEAMMEAGSVYDESGDSQAAERTFLINMLLIGITNKYGIFNERIKNQIWKALASAGAEGIQEGAQEIISNGSQNKPIDWSNVFASTGIGAILGAGGSMVYENATHGDELEKDIKKSLKKITLSKQEIDQVALSELSPKQEQQLTTTQTSRKDLSKGLYNVDESTLQGTMSLEELLGKEFETQPQQGLTQERNVLEFAAPTEQQRFEAVQEEQKLRPPVEMRTRKQPTIEDEIQKAVERKQKILDIQQKKIDKKNDTDLYSELSAKYYHSQRKKRLIDEADFLDIAKNINTPEIRTKAEDLFRRIQEQNKRFTDNNVLSLENLSKRIFKTKDVNSLTDDQQKQLLFEFNEMKKNGIKNFMELGQDDIKNIREQVNQRKELEQQNRQKELEDAENAIRIKRTEGEIPRITETRENIEEGRGRMGRGEQGIELAGEEGTPEGTEAEEEGRAPKEITETQKTLKKFYRGGGEGSMPKGLTAKDVISYEIEELGTLINRDVIEKIKNAIKNGGKIKPLTIEETKGRFNQEGRHRAIALKEGKQIPEEVLKDYPDLQRTSGQIAEGKEEFLNQPKFKEEISEQEASDIEAIAEQAEAIIEEEEPDLTDQDKSENIEQIDTLVNEIDEKLKLLGYYSAEGDKDAPHENASREPERKFKKDLTKFANELKKGLGYEDHFDKKGKKNTVDTNIAPIGGDGTIILWKPNSDYGVYISVSTRRGDRGKVDEFDRADDLIISGLGWGEDRFMWRVTTKQNVYTGLSNQWVKNDITAGEFARMIKQAVDRAEREGIKKQEPKIGTVEEQVKQIKDLASEKKNVSTEKPKAEPKNKVTVKENDRGGIDIFFTEKPSDAILSKLKLSSFRWTNQGGGHWWAMRTDKRLELANDIKREVEGKQSDFVIGENVVYHNYPGWTKIAELKGDEVDLKLEGGQTVTVPITKISKIIGKVSEVKSPDLIKTEAKPEFQFKVGERVYKNSQQYEITAINPLDSTLVARKVGGNGTPYKFNVNDVTKEIKQPEPKIKQKIKSIQNDELNNAIDDYLTSFDLKEGIDPVQLAKGVKVVGIYTKLQVYKFADIVNDLYSKIGDKVKDIFDSLKQAYMAYRETAPKEIYDKMDASLRDIAYEKMFEAKTEKTNQEKLVDAIYEKLSSGEGIKDNPALTKIADEVYGGTKAQGKYDTQETYNALEAAINKWIIENDLMSAEPEEALAELRYILKKIPTQAARTQDKDLLQQFSTPPTLAYFTNVLLNANENDILLEPSGGTGSLVAFQKGRVKEIHVNEIDPKRRALLEYLGFKTYDVDAEFLNSMLPQEIKPTRIDMNPPFSATGGRVQQNSTKFGYKHLLSALQRLENNGRLVAILGEGAEFGRPEATKLFWDKVVDKYNVRADIGIENTDYGKYGTSFGNRVIVIDKTGPTLNRRPELQGTYKTIEEAINASRDIIDTAPRTLADDNKNVSLEERTPAEGTEGIPGRGGIARPGVRGSESVPGVTPKNEPGTNVAKGREGLQPSGTIQPTERETKPERIRREGAEGNQPSDVESNRSNVEYEESDLAKREEEASGFVEYKPKFKPKGSQPHPAKLVESASMAAVDQPTIKYKPNLPEESITEGKISDAQLETIAYIGQRHESMLPSGSRAGYFVGDGTGVGKGRILAGAILDNWRQGRKKAIWVSVSRDLIKDAKRDLDGVGAGHIPISIINDYKTGVDIPSDYNGIIFTTYSSFIRAKEDVKTGVETSRMKQIVKWLGEDGVIVFDEAHKAKNILAAGRGGKPTKTAEAVVNIQESHLPKARVIYASATGATNVKHMGYMTRLGLWGEGLPFPNFMDFLNEIERGGIGAMEMVARDLKALGIYTSRTISFDGIEYEEKEHVLTPDQRRMYDTAAEAWQIVMQNINEAIELTGNSTNAKRFAYSAFWGGHQRFFKQFITALKIPTLIKEVERHLAEDKSVVISLIGTNEASTDRAIRDARIQGIDLEDIDLSPRETLANLVDHAFPVIDYEIYTDENGNLKTQPKKDKDGNSVKNPEAVKLKNELIEKLSDINLPENPLDQIINYFELKSRNTNDRSLRVAELTGRKKRLIKEITKNPNPTAKEKYIFGGKTRYDKRTPDDVKSKDTNIYEMDQFQSGRKRIALISQAASTGITLSSDLTAKNRQKRVQIALELSWSADTQMQTFGRTHRSNQETPPIYVLLSSDVGGEKRFSSTIAKRLASLGALTKGERSGAGGGQLAKYDFENDYGEAALESTYTAMLYGEDIQGIADGKQTLRDMGILKQSGDGGETIEPDDMKKVTLFLNRVLALQIDRQNALFNHFTNQFDSIINTAKETGQYDEGVTDLKAESIKIVGEPKIVHTDNLTKAETKHYQLEVTQKTNPLSYNSALMIIGLHEGRGFYKQVKTGSVVAKVNEFVNTDRLTGRVDRRVVFNNPANNKQYMSYNEFDDKYEEIEDKEAKPLWEEKLKTVPKLKTEEVHVISGAILPLWKQLKEATGDEKLKIIRAVDDSKNRIVGIEIPKSEVGKVLRALNIQRDIRTPEDIFEAVLEQGEQVDLAHGLQLKRTRLYGDDAIELIGRGSMGLDSGRFDELREFGLLNERISYKQRFFIPTDPDVGIDVLTNLLEKYPAQKQGGAGETDIIEPPDEDRFIPDKLYNQQLEIIKNFPMTEGFQPEQIKAYAIAGAYHLENLFKSAGEKADLYIPWYKQMIKQFGEKIRRNLRKIWHEAKNILSNAKNKIVEIGKTPAKETTFGMGLGQVIPNIRSSAEGTNERSKQNLVEENYGLSRTLKQSGNAPALKTLGQGTSNLAKGISEEGKKFMDQFTTPPPVKAQLDKKFKPFYDLAERRLNREYVGNQNEILRVTTNDFKDFRKLSRIDKDGLLEALEDYHHNYLYRGTFIATDIGIRGMTADEIVKKYSLNPAQELVLRQFDELGQATLELVKKGEKEMLFEFKKDISGLFTKDEFIEVLPQFSKYEEYMDAPLDNKVMNDVWNHDPLSRSKLADFAVERKYKDYGKYFYMNLSRPLEQGNWVVHIEKPLDPKAKDSQMKRIFTYFENEADAKQFYEDAKKEGWTLKDRIAKVSELLKNQSDWGRLDQTTLLHLFNTSNIEIPKEVVDQLLKTVKEGYWDKHTIHRNYTPGLKWTAKETEQNIVNLLSESSAKRNKLYGIAKLNEMLTVLENEYGQKVREVGADENELARLKRTMEYTQKFLSGLKYANNNVLNSIRGIMFLWDLGFFRPSFMLQQTTENFQTVMPLAISEGGLSGESDFIKAGADTGKIALAIIEEKLYGRPKIDIDSKLWNMITKLRDMEKVSPLGVKVLFGESGDPKIHYDIVGKGFDAIKNTLSAGGQGIEYITRIHTAATFYRIAKRKGMTDIDEITNYVADMIDLSKANYAKTGTIVAINPRQQRGYNEKSLGRMLANVYLVYKKWASANTGLYRYLWNRSKVAFLTKVMVGIGAGGMKKFPLIMGLYGIASLLMNLFNDDDDSDLDYKLLELENKLNEEVGGKIGSLLNRGAGTYFNVDLSGLMAQGSALPTDVLAPKIGNIKSIPQALYEAPRIVTESVMGRPYTFTTDIIGGAWGGVQLAKGGLDDKEKQRANKKFITALPSTIRSFYQSDIMDTEGLKYRNKTLIKPEDMTDEELRIKSWGFQPERFMKAYDELGKPKKKNSSLQGPILREPILREPTLREPVMRQQY